MEEERRLWKNLKQIVSGESPESKEEVQYSKAISFQRQISDIHLFPLYCSTFLKKTKCE